MTTYLYLADRTGCGHYRALYPLNAIRADSRYSDIDIKVIEPGDDAGIKGKVLGNHVFDVTVPEGCTRVIVQRPTSKVLVACLKLLSDKGVHVTVDLDDDLLALHPLHPSAVTLRELPSHSAESLRTACQLADTVITSTPALAERYASRNGTTLVVRNSIPRSAFRHNTPNPVQHIGWPSAISTHPFDLGVLGNALIGVDVPLVITGPEPEDNIDGKRVRALVRRNADFTGQIEYRDWQDAVSKIHTGIAPLTLTPFNTAKSALKCLELSAAGVPFVKSPTEEYELLGAGITAEGNKPRTWKREIKRLLTDEDLRFSERERNHEIAKQNVYELPHIVDTWAAAWGLSKS